MAFRVDGGDVNCFSKQLFILVKLLLTCKAVGKREKTHLLKTLEETRENDLRARGRGEEE